MRRLVQLSGICHVICWGFSSQAGHIKYFCFIQPRIEKGFKVRVRQIRDLEGRGREREREAGGR